MFRIFFSRYFFNPACFDLAGFKALNVAEKGDGNMCDPNMLEVVFNPTKAFSNI